MIYKTTAIILLACLTFEGFGQSDSSGRKIDHYIGLQANQLFREIFNLAGNNSQVNNPYLINYSLIHRYSGMGFSSGIGYIFDESKTGDPANERETTTNNFFFRIGFEKKFQIGKAWQVGTGMDLLLDNQKISNIVRSNTGFGKSKAETNDKIFAFGTGPRVNISYYVTPRILIGTEASYYYRNRTINEDQKITTTAMETDPNTGIGREVTRTEQTDSEDKSKSIVFSLPAVLWLVVKF